MSILFRATLALATSVALAFLVLPVVAIFARVPPGELIDALGSDAAKDALRVTLETNAISMALIILFGTPAAYWIATRGSRLRDVVVTVVELPLVLPPAVAGIGLLAAFGRLGLLGGSIEALGIDIAFTKAAVVLAVTFVASPFYVRTAVAAFESIDPTLPAAARTLGAGPGRVFLRVALPLAAGGLGAGAALAFARGIGEFGATIMFAGSLQGTTQTLSLAIYEQFDLDFDVALAISAVLVVISAGSPALRQASHPMALRIDYTHPLRAFDARVELTVERGETVALVGPSGAGKTTTLRVVAGLLRPRSGRITVGDETWLDTSAGDRPLAGATTRGLPLPGVRALPAPRRVAERPFRRAERHIGHGAARAVPDLGARGRPGARAVRRRAAARRACPRACPPAGDAAARRAAVRARRTHEVLRALRAARAAARARPPDDPRHARLRGRGRAGRPDRRDRRRARRAGGECRRPRRTSARRLRRQPDGRKPPAGSRTGQRLGSHGGRARPGRLGLEHRTRRPGALGSSSTPGRSRSAARRPRTRR